MSVCNAASGTQVYRCHAFQRPFVEMRLLTQRAIDSFSRLCVLTVLKRLPPLQYSMTVEAHAHGVGTARRICRLRKHSGRLKRRWVRICTPAATQTFHVQNRH